MRDGDEEAEILAGIPDDELAPYLEWREKVRGRNISERTLLATDYINHFNEIVMLLEMVPDMPDMLAECQLWQPKGYQDHFRDSGFSEKQLAIEAYDRVPSKFRRPFEETVGQINAVVSAAMTQLDASIAAAEDPEVMRVKCMAFVQCIQGLINTANGIIHGSQHAMAQSEIDALIGAV
ncbi:MAG TPA: hypothetical protein VEH84_06990 [Alphaproteobacteria bacterium]|nr:hypothetical protein [Alphaproteobacteria bacterium]